MTGVQTCALPICRCAGAVALDDAAAAEEAGMRLGIGLAALTLVLDQLTKWLVLFWVMDPPRVIPVLPFFNLVVVWNRGVSFGMFGGGTVPPWAFVLLSLAIVVALLICLRRAETRWTSRWEGHTPEPQ